MAAATNYAALPTTDAISNDEYPPSPNPTRAPPKPSSNQYATRFWPDPTTLAKRAILIAVVAVSAFVFFKVEKGIFQHQLSTDHAAQSGVTEPVAMYGNNGRPRTGRLNVGYFVNWGIYGRKYPPALVPADKLSHLLYAFANVRSSGEVYMSDDWADKDIHYPGDSWNEHGDNLYGNFKQIYLLKKKHRHLKVMLSIGGWTYSPNFHPVVVSPTARAEFVRSSVKLLEDYGLDGLDVDYEYPSNDDQARGYTELLKMMREALDEHAARKGGGARFELSIAAPCGPSNYKQLFAREMDRYLDMWNLMAYDYAGSWEKIANHMANVHKGDINTDKAVKWYQSQGIAPHKLIIGMPLYGRSFMETDGPGTPFNGIGPGSWEKGMYDYRALPLPGSSLQHDAKAMAVWSYDPSKREMISFDDPIVTKWKAEWIIKENLGGAMFWELSGDKAGWGGEPGREEMEKGEYRKYVPGQSLVKVTRDAFGTIDQSENWLRYEGSRFENMRKGMS